MNKLILFAASCILLASCSNEKGNVKIRLPEDFQEKTLVVSHITIKNMFEATQVEDLTVIYDTHVSYTNLTLTTNSRV